MASDLKNHYQSLSRQKRTANLLSLEDEWDNDIFEDDLLDEQVEKQMLADQLSSQNTVQQQQIMLLLANGYNLKEIAGKGNLPIKEVKRILDDVYGRLLYILYMEEGY